ncbi:MAG: hypothetical protein KDI07_15975, partial [Anaerolineae bacterium]|nr:hypothetical protein [Anaerolineae bacterium]
SILSNSCRQAGGVWSDSSFARLSPQVTITSRHAFKQTAVQFGYGIITSRQINANGAGKAGLTKRSTQRNG